MPWHDIAMHVIGEPVKDMCRHFIQYWNFVRYQMAKTQQEILNHEHHQNAIQNLSFKIQRFMKEKVLGGIKSRLKHAVKKNPVQMQNVQKAINHEVVNGKQEKQHSMTPEDQKLKQTKLQQSQSLNLNNRDQGDSFKQSKQNMRLKFLDMTKNMKTMQENEIKQQEPHQIQLNEHSVIGNYIPKEKFQQVIKTKEDLLLMSKEDINKIETYPIMNSKAQRTFKKKVAKLINVQQFQHLLLKKHNSESTAMTINANKITQQDNLKMHQSIDLENQLINGSQNVMQLINNVQIQSQQGNKKKEKNINKSKKKENLINDVFFETKMLWPMEEPNQEAQVELQLDQKEKQYMIEEKEYQSQLDIIAKYQIELQQDEESHHCQCQMLRSASCWSIGLHPQEYESSILSAYLELIEESEHFIYIENQFFISSLAGQNVKNRIVEAILLRISCAIEQQAQFKVVVVLPLLPGFEGDIQEPGAAVLRIQMYWQYQTICRGGNSLYEQLAKITPDPSQYISFFGLRNHAMMLNGKPATEIVYVHSKMMIVDDKVAIIGSANINDRSMLGMRDSEIAMLVEDNRAIAGQFNGCCYEMSKFAHNLRVKIWCELFGMNAQQVQDPLSQELWRVIQTQTKNNTLLYRQIFACYPDDSVKAFADFQLFYQAKTPDIYLSQKDNIKGLAVEFPLRFCENQDFTFNTFSKENLAPHYNFT